VEVTAISRPSHLSARRKEGEKGLLSFMFAKRGKKKKENSPALQTLICLEGEKKGGGGEGKLPTTSF